MNKRKNRASSQTPQFASVQKKEFYTKMQERTLHRERGFCLPLRAYPQFQREIETRGWQTLAGAREDGCDELVKEFYANTRLDDREKEEGLGQNTYKTWFRGTKIDYSPATIDKLLELPVEDPYRNKTSFHEMWDTCRRDEIAREIAFPGATWDRNDSCILWRVLNYDARVWAKFLLDSVMPTSHKNDLTVPEALLVYCVVQKCPIDVGQIIADRIVEVANNNVPKIQLPYPNLITKLVKTQWTGNVTGKRVMQELLISDKEIDRLEITTGKDRAKFFEAQRAAELERQQEAATSQQIPPNAQQDSFTQMDSSSICVAMGTILRQLDDLRANQELQWDVDDRQDMRFRRRIPYGEIEQRMVQLSIEAGTSNSAREGQDGDIGAHDSD